MEEIGSNNFLHLFIQVSFLIGHQSDQYIRATEFLVELCVIVSVVF